MAHDGGGASTEASGDQQASAAPQPPTGVLRLRGLPFAAQEPDVVEFISRAYPLRSVFICKRNGRSTGEAFIVLENASQAAELMEARQRAVMGPRYIEVFNATEADLSTAKTLSQDRLKGYVVRMRGMPYSASASDVLRFLQGLEVVRGIEGVVFTYTPDGRPTGECFVELQSEEAQKEAMKRHKELMGTRYIELFTSTKADLIQAIQHNRLVLGAYRKRYMVPHHMHHGPMMYGPHGGHHGMMGGHAMSYMHGGQGLDDVTDLFSGINLGQGGYQSRMGLTDMPRGGRGYGRAGPGMGGGRGYYDAGGRANGMGARGRGGYRAVSQNSPAQQLPYSLGGSSTPSNQQSAQQQLMLQQQQQQPYMQQQQFDTSSQFVAAPGPQQGQGIQSMGLQQTSNDMQYFGGQGSSGMQGGSMMGGSRGQQYITTTGAGGQTYTLAIQLPSGNASGGMVHGDTIQLGGGLEMQQIQQMQ